MDTQANGTGFESPEINLCIYNQLIFDRGKGEPRILNV